MNETAPRVLVIDDNPSNLRVLFNLLTEHGMHVIISQGGLRGIERAKSAKPHVILLDIQMPDVDGYEVCRQLRRDSVTRETPILFATAYTDASSKLRGFEAGGSDYITKPFDANEVAARVQVHIANARLKAELATKNQELTRIVEAQREAAEFRRRFFAMSTHEFRSPLMTIQLAASMIRRYGDQMTRDEREEECRTIESTVTELNTTLSSVLGYVREHTGETGDALISPVDPEAELRQIVERFQADEARKTNVRSITFAFEGQAVTAAVDPALLEHVLGNFLENAVKFSPDDSPIEVEASLENDWLRVAVRDYGLGIPEHEIHTLFEPFARSSNAADIRGTGLGLTVVRQLVDRAGGEISVESTEGEGSTFSFSVPAATGEATARET